MTDDDRQGEGASGGNGRWDPLPQGDYDDGATAFVKLPEGGIDALLAGNSPLAAPGHGYVPPQITVSPATGAGTDPAATGGWGLPADGAQWPAPDDGSRDTGADDRFTYRPEATQQWAYEEPAAPQAPGQDVTGQWSIPVAGGDLPDESGEFTASALVEQWGGTPPPTLPGGAAAPWAAEPAGQPWDRHQPAEPPAAEGHPGTHDQFAPSPGDSDPAGHPGEDPAGRYTTPPDPAGPNPGAGAMSEDHGAGVAGDRPDGGYRAEQAPERPAEPTDDAEAADTAGSGPQEAGDGPAAHGATADGQETQAEPEEPHAPPHDDHPLASFVLSVNGADRPVTDAWIGESLLYVLRERLGLAGAKDGCSQGECGACNVQVDGRLVASCLVPAVTAAGSEVRTVEGLAADGQPSDVQRALARCGAVQCGFCVPGMAMTLHDLLEGNPAPTELETRQALCGNLCRCSGYRGVLDAVQDVVAEREAHAAAEDEADAEEARIPHQAGPGAGGVHPSAFEDTDPAAFEAGDPHEGSYGQPYDPPYGQDGGQA